MSSFNRHKTALQRSNRVIIIREAFIYLFIFALLPYVCFPFLCSVKFFSSCLRQVFFIWETKRVVASHVRQLVVLYSNNCMGICLGGLSIGCLRWVVVLLRWSIEQAWLYLQYDILQNKKLMSKNSYWKYSSECHP